MITPASFDEDAEPQQTEKKKKMCEGESKETGDEEV